MINFLHLLLKRIAFFLKAANGKGHGTHSPFVYRFITDILNDTRFFYAFELIDNQKKIFINASNKLTNKKHADNIRSILNSLPNSSYHQLLFKIVHFYHPSNVLEIGASLGITTAYLSLANGNINITSLVETPIQDLLAKENLKELGVNNVNIIQSADLSIPIQDISNKKYELVLLNMAQINNKIDIEEIVKHTEDDAIFIFLSKNESITKNILWNKILNLNTTTISVELFSMRIAFFRKEQYEKEHYTIQF